MPVPTTPAVLPRTSRREQIFDVLKDAIVSGDLAPGETLSDKKLEEWLGASRTPIRDAISRLANLGLVEVLPQKGTRVAPIVASEVAHTVETLGAIYAATVRQAVPLLTDSDRSHMKALSKSLARVRITPDERARHIDDLFFVFLRRYNNRLVLQVRDRLSPHIERTLRVSTVTAAPGGAENVENLVRVATAGDANAAAHAASAYFSLVREWMLTALPDSGASPAIHESEA
ncbi:MAG: GntR family transcriptional regulator [Actinobacteria bacterium HGW-Actinobacteria-11]|nr:MAG: GntR family transcriptional regulator [Actinobacteria bacterium HGW-Actinobacteria-11]